MVAIKGGEPAQMFDMGIKELGGMSRFVKKGQSVVIKPNIGWDKPPELGANTNPDLVRRVIEHCKEAGASKIYVFDTTCSPWEMSYKSSGIAEAAEKAAPDAQAAGTEGPDAEVSAILGEELAEECAAEDLAGERGAAAQNGQDLQDARPAPDGYEYVTRFRRSFASKIIQNEPAQDLYTEIKNAVLSYGGVKSRLCVGSENFRIGRQKIAKLAVAGKTLMLYLALDPKQFEDTAYRFEDMSDKRSHAATPLRVRLTSRRAVRKAKELLDILARKFGLSSVGCIYTDFHYAYRSDEYLIGKGLIKPYRALVKKKN